VESSCECGNEPSGSIKCWETIEWLHNWWPLGSAQLHRVARFVRVMAYWSSRGKVLILHSYAAAHMLKAATTLKFFYPNLIYFTCLTHGLQRVAD
jgi:hypothetical protein